MAADPGVSFQRVAADTPPLAGDAALRAVLGGFIAAAVPRYYSLVPMSPDGLAAQLGDTMGVEGTEFENAAAAFRGEDAVGLVTWLPLAQLEAAQKAGAVTLMRHIDRSALPPFLRAMSDYGKTVEPISGSGLYLSRIAVSESARGLGIGRLGVQQVIEAADGDAVSLHVSADNQSAIGLYQSLGFEFAPDGGDFESRVMVRPASR